MLIRLPCLYYNKANRSGVGLMLVVRSCTFVGCAMVGPDFSPFIGGTQYEGVPEAKIT